MRRVLFIFIVLLTSCSNNADPNDYENVRAIWTDNSGNRLLRCFSHVNAFVNKKDWLYEINCNGRTEYYQIENGFNHSYYKDSLILFHRDDTESDNMGESKEHWIQVKDSTGFETVDTTKTKFSKEYLGQKINGVYKVEGDSLVKVCDYKACSEWPEITKYGAGTYYFGTPGMFYDHLLDLKKLSDCK